MFCIQITPAAVIVSFLPNISPIDNMFCIQIKPAVVIVSSMQNISPINTMFCIHIRSAAVIVSSMQNISPIDTTVSHFSYAPLFKGPHFSQKCWNRTFSMIIYLLAFNLFDDIEKKI